MSLETPLFFDGLPPEQPVISTSSLERFGRFVDLLIDDQKKYSTIAAATGPAGIGKTVAVGEVYRRINQSQSHTGMPAALLMTLLPQPRPKTIGDEISNMLQQKLSSETVINKIAKEIADLIEGNDIRLLGFDEADRLDRKCFDLLRSIVDKSGCPIMLVGLPDLLSVIKRYEQFNSRVGLRMSFDVLNEDEVINKFLPHLVFAQWKYDPENEEDKEMGRFIWQKVKPSIRKMRNIIQLADQVTRKTGAAKIDLKCIKECMQFSLDSNPDVIVDQSQEYDTQKTVYETASEERNAAKMRKKSPEAAKN